MLAAPGEPREASTRERVRHVVRTETHRVIPKDDRAVAARVVGCDDLRDLGQGGGKQRMVRRQARRCC